eukprot:882918-Amorphochlora_amoeboformis.AAC.1
MGLWCCSGSQQIVMLGVVCVVVVVCCGHGCVLRTTIVKLFTNLNANANTRGEGNMNHSKAPYDAKALTTALVL